MREVQVILIGSGCVSYNVIADSLNLFAKTVNRYRYHVFEKLGVKSDVQLILLVVKYNVIELGIREIVCGEEVSALPGCKGPLAARSLSEGALAAELGIRYIDNLV